MGETEDEFVDDSVNSNSPADQLQSRVLGIVEDEVVEIELAQMSAPNASGKLASLMLVV